MRKKTRVEVEPPTKDVDKLLSDIQNMSVSNEDMETANATLLYYAKQKIPAGYVLHTADIVGKSQKGYVIEVLIEKVKGLGR